MIQHLLHPDNSAPVAGSAVSCALGFDLHTALGVVGQIIGILSGLASLAWVGYQWYQSRQK